MGKPTSLHELLRASAAHHPDRIAVEDPGKAEVTYRDLDAVTDVLSDRLAAAGVVRGDRVGICAAKSIGTVAAIFAILKAGGAYVPVDADAPAARNAFIFTNCSVKAIVAERRVMAALESELGDSVRITATDIDSLSQFGVDLVLLEIEGDGGATAEMANDLAYILYTSGSTGAPKGVMLSHGNALGFIEWCSREFKPTEKDKFSSHAPFHFDLSILDIYLPIRHGATLVLIGETMGKQPAQLAPAIADCGITVWYSTPSILRMLVEYGRMERHDYSALRLVFFAGEVFPIKHLQALKKLWPKPVYYNLYGPTETNVCTYYKVPSKIPADRKDPFPIGKVCSGDAAKVMDESDAEVAEGEEGELYISGPSVMQGYWNLPERNASAFFTDGAGVRWYKTGDIVRDSGRGNYLYISRRDRMVKRRGYRVELGEIESALYRHPEITEAAVVALPDQDAGIHIKAFLSWSNGDKPSLIALKQFCAQNLPIYMIPDKFSVQPSLPKTSTDKIDYQKLMEIE